MIECNRDHQESAECKLSNDCMRSNIDRHICAREGANKWKIQIKNGNASTYGAYNCKNFSIKTQISPILSRIFKPIASDCD